MITKAQQKSVQKYNKKAYERISLFVKQGEKKKIQEVAKQRGLSLNKYINQLIEKDVKMTVLKEKEYTENILKIHPLKRDSVSQCIEIAKQFPRIKRLIIFGSSVTDRCDEQSDVDICWDIDGKNIGMDIYEASKQMHRACDHNCDIVTYGKISGRFKEIIDTKGVVVYEL